MASRWASQSTSGVPSEADTLRLTYTLELLGRGETTLSARGPDGTPIRDGELKRLDARLHPLDRAIAREMMQATGGRVPDATVARLLPLLAQRRVQLGGEQLVFSERALTPRLRITQSGVGGALATLALADDDGTRLDLAHGRLLAGSQAFFLRGNRVAPVSASQPWELQSWARNPTRELRPDFTVAERDRLVSELKRAGVPEEDLAVLAVRRAPPQRIVARMLPPTDEDVRMTLEADYDGVRVLLTTAKVTSPYLIATDAAPMSGIIERDLAVENEARAHLHRLGFRFDAAAQAHVAQGEAAVRALDPRAELFPAEWLIDRTAHAPRFRADLSLGATAHWDAGQGLVSLDVEVAADPAEREAAMAAALIDMRELIEWLHSGKHYLRLKDGSYVAPSPRFKQGLRVIDDLGATAGRVWVSPLCIGLLRALGDAAALAAADQATTDWLAELASTSTPPRVTPPAGLASILREYQCRGLDWLAMLHRHRLTGILADDMGLGKTVQALALLGWVREQEGAKPSLVVAPTSVVTVWRDEAARFTPDLSVLLWHGDPRERQSLNAAAYDLVVTSYGILRRDAELLAQVGFRYLILDEAQSAKNAATQNARAVRRLKGERRLALTGTPIENRPEELWSAFDFLAPGFLGSLKSFRKRYARPIATGDEQALALLRSRIQPLVLRRLKSEVAPELPPKVESVVRCEMGPAQRALYEHLSGELTASVRKKIERVGIERARLDILAALTRLRQICCDPSLLPAPPGARVPPSAKLELFGELMREALASERRVVVFSQFVEMQKRLIAVIRRLGVEPLWLHGQSRHRDKIVDAFQKPSGPPVIVVSLRAGGTGLTLTRADTVMHYDPWWNPAVERQATDRTHRLGQRHQVTVYKLVCARSIEERVLALAARKDKVAEDLLSSAGGSGAKEITADEVLALFAADLPA